MFASMFLFSFAMSITPGPVNTVILSTSLNHGLKDRFPIFQAPQLVLPCF